MAERRWLRRAAVVAAVGAGAVGVAVLGGWLWLRSERGNAWLEARIEGAVQGALVGGDFRIGSLSTDVIHHLEVADVVLSDPEGRTVVGVDRLRLVLDPFALVRGHVRATSLDVSGVTLDVEVGEDGLNSFHRIFGPPDPTAPDTPWQGLPVDVTVERLALEGGHLRYDTWEAVDVGLTAAVFGRGEVILARDLRLEGRLVEPREGPLLVHGDIGFNGDRIATGHLVVEAAGSRLWADGQVAGLEGTDGASDLRLAVEDLDLVGLDALLDEPGLAGDYRGQLRLTGPMSALRVRGELQGRGGTEGRVALDVTADPQDEALPWSGTVTLHELHAEDAYPGLSDLAEVLGDELVLDGTLRASGQDGGVQATFEGGPQDVLGVALRSLRAGVAYEDGVLTLADVRAVGPIGDLAVQGTLDLERGPMDLRAGGTVAVARLGQFGAEGMGGTATLDVRITGDTRAADAVTRIAGEATVRGFTYEQDVSFERVAAEIVVLARPEATTVRGAVQATGGLAYGVEIDEVTEPSLAVLVPTEGPVTVDGAGTATGVRYPDVFSIARVAGPWHVAVPEEGGPVVQAEVDLGAWDLLQTVDGTSGTAAIAMSGDLLRYDATLRQGRRAAVVADGTFDTVAQRVVLDELVLEPAEGRRWENPRPISFTLTEDGGITDAAITLVSRDTPPERVQRIELTGTLGTSGPLDATLLVEELDLGLAGALRPDLAYLAGDVDLALTLGGTADAAVLSGTVSAWGTFLDGQTRPAGIVAQVDALDGRARFEVAARVEDAPLLALRGALPVNLDLAQPGLRTDGEVDLVLDVAPGHLERFEAFSGETDLPPGRVSAHLAARGPLLDPVLELAAVVETPVEGWTLPGRVEIGVTREGETLSWWADALEGLSRRGAIDGTGTTRLGEVIAWALGEGPEPDFEDYALWAAELDGRVELLGMPASSLGALAGLDADLDGELLGGFTYAGSLSEPQVAGGLNWVDASIAEVPLQGAFASIVPSEDGYALDLRAFFEEGDLVVAGNVPVDVDLREEASEWVVGDLDLELGGSGLPLAVIGAFVPGVTEASGHLEMEGTVGGSFLDPSPDFSARLVDGTIAYEPLLVRYDDIALEVHATRDRAELDRLSFRTTPMRTTLREFSLGGLFGGVVAPEQRPPSLVATATADLVEWSLTDVRGELSLDQMWVSALPDQTIQVSGDLRASGTWPEVAIRGEIGLDAGYLGLDAAEFLEVGPLELDERIVVHRRGYAPPAEEEAGAVEPPFYASFDVDVDVDLQRNLALDVAFPFLDQFGSLGAALLTANMSAGLGGALQVTLVDAQPEIVGEVEVLEGKVAILRSNLSLTEGTVSFLGDPSNPILDVTSRMTVGGSYLEMVVSGSPYQPEIDFFSPVYQSDAQILTILITGQDPQALSAQQGSSVADALVGLALSAFGGARVGGTVTVDPDGTIRAGVPVLQGWFAEVLYDVNPDLNENEWAIQLEGQLARRLVLLGVYGDRRSWADLFWELRF